MLDQLIHLDVLIGAAVAAVAGLMRGFAGVGSGMLMAPIFAIVFGPLQTVAIIILMEVVVTVQLLPGVAKEIDWPMIGLMGVVAAACMPVGSWLLSTLDPALMTRATALIVLVFAVILLAGWRYDGTRHPAA
ncbi:MAG: sulfite exporter TauE/SafE family protein, partial [Gammaproteobacteria bacterium]